MPTCNYFIGIYVSRICPWTPYLPHSANIEEIMFVQTSAVSGTTPITLLFQIVVPGHCSGIVPHSNYHIYWFTPLIEVFLSILESSRHELGISYSLTLVTPSLRGWEAFPTPGVLTHITITRAFSPMAPQVTCITMGTPLCPWCFGRSLKRSARQ